MTTKPRITQTAERVLCDVCNGKGRILTEHRSDHGAHAATYLECSQCDSRGYIGPDTLPPQPPTRAVVERFSVIATHHPLERALFGPTLATRDLAEVTKAHLEETFPGNEYQIVRIDTEITLVGDDV